jgi:hypothetical protein
MGKAVPDVLIMDGPSGCQMAFAYLYPSQLPFPVITYVGKEARC